MTFLGSRCTGILTGLVVMSVALAGCGGGDDSAAVPESTQADQPATITIENFKFVPDTLTVTSGQEITVVNNDSVIHTITADGGEFDSGELEAGQTYSIKVTVAGNHPYICDIHQYMTGRIIVR